MSKVTLRQRIKHSNDMRRQYFKNWWNAKKERVCNQFLHEIREFVGANVNNPTMDKRIWSLYYFLGQHNNYDSLIITLHRFLAARDSYSKNEVVLFKLLLLKLELPLFWLNRIIFPVKFD